MGVAKFVQLAFKPCLVQHMQAALSQSMHDRDWPSESQGTNWGLAGVPACGRGPSQAAEPLGVVGVPAAVAGSFS